MQLDKESWKIHNQHGLTVEHICGHTTVTKAVIENCQRKGLKKIIVLYVRSKKEFKQHNEEQCDA